MNKSRFVICGNKEVCVRFAPSSGFRSIHKNGNRYYYNTVLPGILLIPHLSHNMDTALQGEFVISLL